MKTSQPRRSHLRLGLCLAVLAMLAACSSPPPFFKSSKWPPERDREGITYDVKVVGNYAYVADGAAGLHVIDVSNPTNCVRVGGYDTMGPARGVSGTARGVAVSGNYAYVADFDEGLQVIDVRNPAKAVRVGGYIPLKEDR